MLYNVTTEGCNGTLPHHSRHREEVQNQGYFLQNRNALGVVLFLLLLRTLWPRRHRFLSTQKAPGWHPRHKWSLLDTWTRPDKPLSSSVSTLLMTHALGRVHIRNLQDLSHYMLTGAGQTLTSPVDKSRDVEGEGKCSVLDLTEQFLKERDEVGCESQHNLLLPAFARPALLPAAPASHPASPSAKPFSSLWHTILFSGTPQASSAWSLSAPSNCRHVLPLSTVYLPWNRVGTAPHLFQKSDLIMDLITRLFVWITIAIINC